MNSIENSIWEELQGRNEDSFNSFSNLIKCYNELYGRFLLANSAAKPVSVSLPANEQVERLTNESNHLKGKLNEVLLENSDKTKLIESLQKEVVSLKKQLEVALENSSNFENEKKTLVLVNKELNDSLKEMESRAKELAESKSQMETAMVRLNTEKDRFFVEILKMKEDEAVKMNDFSQMEEELISRRKQFEGEMVFLRKENEELKKTLSSMKDMSPQRGAENKFRSATVLSPPSDKKEGGLFSHFKIFTGASGGSTSSLRPDGSRMSIGKGSDGSFVLNLSDIRTLYQHEKSVSFMKISFKGDLLASGGDEGVIKVYNIFADREKNKLMNTSYDQIFTCADLSSQDPDVIVTGDTTKKVVLWSLSQGRAKQTLNYHTDRINTVGFMTSDSHKVVSGANDMTMKLSDLVKGNIIKTFAPGSSPLAVSNDYALIYSVHSDGSLKLWSENKAFPVHNEPDYHLGKITCLQQSNDSNYLATSDKDGIIQIFDLRMHKRLHRISSTSYFNSFERNHVSFSPDDSKLIAGNSDGSILVWNLTGKPTLNGRHETKIGAAIHSVNISMVSNSLFASTSKGDVIAIDFK